MSAPIDRVKLLRASTTLNGIDFVDVDRVSKVIHVHFMNPVAALVGVVDQATITGGGAIPEVPVVALDWDQTNKILEVQFDTPGDYSLYTLKLSGQSNPNPPPLDPYFDHALFSFWVGCDIGLDCAAPALACRKDPPEIPAIDYLAKDFQSFRDALLAFSSLRYPEWQERSEADFGVMFLEALSSLADDLSYFQDRVGAEAYLETATERRSLVRLARLVDYEPRPATAARVLLRVKKMSANAGTITAPASLRAQGPDGALIDFETGRGLADSGTYSLRNEYCEILPYWWDDADRCLRAGATGMWVETDLTSLASGQKILIETTPTVAGGPIVRELVTLSAPAEKTTDPLTNTTVTRLVWRAGDALTHDHDLTSTKLWANLVPATQGQRVTEVIGIDATGSRSVLTRVGPNGTPQYLYTLRDAPLAWLAPEDDPSGAPRPEIEISGAHPWSFRRSLLDAGPFDEAFTVDPMRYRPVGTASSDGTSAAEYDGSDGDTIRFGDGSFGTIPEAGSTFTVSYRVGGGAAGNIAAGTSFNIDPESSLAQLGVEVDNPFPATGGADPEPDDSVRRNAPLAFRANMRRAPLPADYERFARELPWVSRSSTRFRFTGSWLAAFTTPDPVGSEVVTPDQRVELVEQLDRVRLAGRESLVRAPEYVPLDIGIYVCARSDAFNHEVEGAIRDALSAGVRADGSKGFFHPDHFTFGQALWKATLEAAVQRVEGVQGVADIYCSRRHIMDDWASMPASVRVAPWQIIQVDNDPGRPWRGRLAVKAKGGK